jgi:plastocyanin
VVTAPPPAPSTPSGTVVRIRDGEFLPGRLVVIVGHPVQWQNFDTAGRQVEAVKGASFSSGVIATGKVFSWTPHRLGKIRYRDPAHPGAVGTIVVVS